MPVPAPATARALFGSQSPLSTAPSSFSVSETSSPVLKADITMYFNEPIEALPEVADQDGLAQLLLSLAQPQAGPSTAQPSALVSQADVKDVDMDMDASRTESVPPVPLGRKHLPGEDPLVELRDDPSASTRSMTPKTGNSTDGPPSADTANGSGLISGHRVSHELVN